MKGQAKDSDTNEGWLRMKDINFLDFSNVMLFFFLSTSLAGLSGC